MTERKPPGIGLPAEALLPTPLLPTPRGLRKEIERLPETVGGVRGEQAVREVVGELNRRIVAWLRAPAGRARWWHGSGRAVADELSPRSAHGYDG